MAEWTEKDINRVKELLESGLTTREIAAEFEGRTRNSIIGIMHRKGLVSRPKAKVIHENSTRKEAMKKSNGFVFGRRKASKRVPPTIIEPPLSVTTGVGVQIAELRSNHCRDIIGYYNGVASDAVYCGAPKHDKTSYCEYHASINFNPQARRR